MHVNSSMRPLIWSSLLDADYGKTYYGMLASSIQVEYRIAQAIVAVASSAVVTGWAFWGTPGLDWIWQGFSILAVIVAIVLPIWNPSASLKTACELSGEWSSIKGAYELLWAREAHISEADAAAECARIQTDEKPLPAWEATLRPRQRLARRCQAEVLRRRRLSNT